MDLRVEWGWYKRGRDGMGGRRVEGVVEFSSSDFVSGLAVCQGQANEHREIDGSKLLASILPKSEY